MIALTRITHLAVVITAVLVVAAGSAGASRASHGPFATLELRTPSGVNAGTIVFRRPTKSEVFEVDTNPDQIYGVDLAVQTSHAWERLDIRGGRCADVGAARPYHIWGGGAGVRVIGISWPRLAARRWAVELYKHSHDRSPTACADHSGGSEPTLSATPPPLLAVAPRRLSGGGLEVTLVEAGSSASAGTAKLTPSRGGFTVSIRVVVEVDHSLNHVGPAAHVRAGTCSRLVGGDREIQLGELDGDANNGSPPWTATADIRQPLGRFLRTPHVIEVHDGDWLEGGGTLACGVLSR
jgi:hypothetical protein